MSYSHLLREARRGNPFPPSQIRHPATGNGAIEQAANRDSMNQTAMHHFREWAKPFSFNGVRESEGAVRSSLSTAQSIQTPHLIKKGVRR